MKQIFVNLKRFDVPKEFGGICPYDDPHNWIRYIIDESMLHGLGTQEDVDIVYLVPESLIIPGIEHLMSYKDNKSISIGCQGVFREDIDINGNFGAFTTNLPAAAAYNMGCTTAIIGHSEERKDKLNIINRLESIVNNNEDMISKASTVVDEIINEEVLCGLNRDLDILLCIGESHEEKGEGTKEQQETNVKRVLYNQLKNGLKGIEEFIDKKNIVIGYEPIWAIGPGKTPPNKEYIAFVSEFIKSTVEELYSFNIPVVYGGGLKEDNAAMLGSIETVDGGLVALTKFTGDIGFYPEGLKNIILKFLNK